MENTKKPAQVIPANEGKAVSVIGDSYRIVVSGDATNNDYAVIDMLVPPGGGPGPHAHKNIHETFYVIEGEIELTTEDGVTIAKEGSFVTIPKGGIIHGFKNKTNGVAHLWCMVVPAGLDKFFEEIGEPSTFGTFTAPPPMNEVTAKKLKAIAEKYGQEVFPPDYLEKKNG